MMVFDVSCFFSLIAASSEVNKDLEGESASRKLYGTSY